MPRPRNKIELLNASREGYARLREMVESLPLKKQKGAFPFDHRDKNVRDVLAHLHEWHLMMLGWYDVGMSGEKPDMPAPGYTWRTTPELNAAIWTKYQSTSLSQVRKRLDGSHETLLQLIVDHSDDELFTKRRYPWTGTTSLGAYLTSATSSHYDWAAKLLRRYIRALDS